MTTIQKQPQPRLRYQVEGKNYICAVLNPDDLAKTLRKECEHSDNDSVKEWCRKARPGDVTFFGDVRVTAYNSVPGAIVSRPMKPAARFNA